MPCSGRSAPSSSPRLPTAAADVAPVPKRGPVPAGKEALTLGDLYRGLRERFSGAEVPEPEVSARRFAAEASGCGVADISLAPQTPMTVRMVSHADAMAARRIAGEPLQYVLGSWAFRRLDLAVDKRALIPRPETEVTAGIAIDWLTRTVRRQRSAQPLVADLGTGCGAIALSIADEVPQAHVLATDRSAGALALAAANLAGLGSAASRVSLFQGDWFEALPGLYDPHGISCTAELRGQLDLIVSNPPYVADGQELPPEVDGWEPHEALYAGPDGLSALRHIIQGARRWLAPGGLLGAGDRRRPGIAKRRHRRRPWLRGRAHRT